MPRLQILQHKSYHPYLEKNKQRVREDEARAQAEELAEEQRQIDTEAEARLGILRRRAGSPSFVDGDGGVDEDLPSTSSARDTSGPTSLLERHRKEKAREEKRERKKRDRLDFDFPSEARRKDKGKGKEREKDTRRDDEGDTRRWETGGHVNLFADLERDDQRKPQPAREQVIKAKKDEVDPFTLYLGRPDKETKPWYADRELKRVEDRETGEEAEERRERERRKDVRSKNRHDPLTQITSLLSTSKPHTHTHRHAHARPPAPARKGEPQRSATMTERERALALMAKSAPRPGGGRWDDTPSTVGGSWADDWERQKANAGSRFFDSSGGLRPRPPNGRSWEV